MQPTHTTAERAAPGVKPALAAKRRTRPVVENHDYAAFARRVIRAQARRIADGDIEELAYLFGLQRELHQAIHTAITGLRAQGYSWADIALRLGITRQAAPTNAGLPPNTADLATPVAQYCQKGNTMMDTGPPAVDPITTHLRDAAEQIRLANHASYRDRREITDLCDTFGALSALLTRLPQLVAHLHTLVDRAHSHLYETDGGQPAAETLNSAQLAIDEAFAKLTTAGNAITDAWTDIGHLRIHDPDTD